MIKVPGAKRALQFFLFVGMSALVFLQGCEGQRHSVIAATGTNIGVEISQNPASQTPQAKLGYQRTELAIVPTNRSSDGKEATSRNGATDVPDVLIELKYAGIFDWGASSGIYQRLAVGSTAVSQKGAAVMFVRDNKGEVSSEAVAALAAVEGTFSDDKEGKCIRDWIKAEPANRQKLRDWLQAKKINADVPMFARSQEFAAKRAEAVADRALAIPCN